MRDAPRLQAAIDILDAILDGEPADRAVHRWARTHRFAGSKDRAAIGDRVYACLRRLRSFSWPLRGVDTSPARAAVIGSVIAAGRDPASLFNDQVHGPTALTAAESAAIAAQQVLAPDPVRLDYPDWLDDVLRDSLGLRFEATMAALQERAPVDIRVNLHRAAREDVAALLAAEGVETQPVDDVQTALRAPPGTPVKRTEAYRTGLVELQDAGSQAAAAFAAVEPGETVLDFCAGGGGKALLFADALAGSGRVVAFDAAPSRMQDLPARAKRAGVAIECATAASLPALEGRCDLVFVDAPCSGTGSWRRDPGGKWRLSAERLGSLIETQQRIVAEAARYVAPGGRLAFCLCSMLTPEANSGRMVMGRPPVRECRITPDQGFDGFYCAVW